MGKTKKLFRTIWRLLHDYGRTDEVFRLYDLTPKWIHNRLLQKLHKYPEGRALLRGEFRSETLKSRKSLLEYPEGTLGHELGKLQLPNLYSYQKNKSAVATAFVDIHDPLHVLTGYDTRAYDEACLQAFSFHHLPVPAPLIIAIGFALSNPKSIPDIYRGYMWGKRVPWLLLVKWEDYLDKPVVQVKQELQIENTR